MTSPFMPQPARPFQQLMAAMQWGQQQQLAKQEALRAQQMTTAQIVQNFMTMAPQQKPEDRKALAMVLGRAANVDPELLLGAVAARPVATATTNDEVNAARAAGIELPALQRAATMLPQVPDEIVRDATVNAATSTISGMPAGQARTSATQASRSSLSDADLIEGLSIGMGLKLSAAQRKDAEVQAEQLQQNLIKLADDRTAEAARIAIMRAELQLKAQQMTLMRAGQVEEAARIRLGRPKEILDQMITLQTTMTSGDMSPEAKLGYSALQTTLKDELVGLLAPTNPGAAKLLNDAFTPERVFKMSPSQLESLLGRKTQK